MLNSINFIYSAQIELRTSSDSQSVGQTLAGMNAIEMNVAGWDFFSYWVYFQF